MTAFQAVIANNGNLPGQVCPGRDELNDLADAQAPAVADFRLENHGSILILWPISRAAKVWSFEQLRCDDTQIWGRDGVVIEPRYISDIVSGIIDEGFSIVGSAL